VARIVNEYIPLLHIPIPKRHNPLVIVPTRNVVEVSIERGNEDLIIEGEIPDEVFNPIVIFTQLLMKKLRCERKFKGFKIRFKGGYTNTLYLYALLTNLIVEQLIGSIDSEIIRSLYHIDREIGFEDSIHALRLALIIKKPFIWRLGEDAISLDKMIYVEVISRKLHTDMRLIHEIPLIDLITHVAGLSIIEGFKRISEGRSLRGVLRVMNSLWHILYGVRVDEDMEMSEGDYKVFVKEINGCSLITFRIVSGDNI